MISSIGLIVQRIEFQFAVLAIQVRFPVRPPSVNSSNLTSTNKKAHII
ncbi:MAG: hypothetical protein JWM20_650 [Patescibacteria group bacterium]|nr:hypothetical protein [Patescibacteria group bacterium]